MRRIVLCEPEKGDLDEVALLRFLGLRQTLGVESVGLFLAAPHKKKRGLRMETAFSEFCLERA